MNLRKRGFAGIALALVGSVAAIGIAIAAFDSSGQGDGIALSGSMLPVTVAATVGGDTPSTLLQPGSTADVILRVTNSNAASVTLTAVTGNGTITASGGIGSCPTGSTGVTFTDQTSLSTTIPASSTVLIHLAGAASMSSSSLSGCQGATFSIPVAVTSEQI